LQEGDGLDAGNLEPLAAADVFAGEHVVAADHVGLGLGELCAIALVSIAGERILFTADEPADLVFISFAAVGAGECVVALLRPFFVKVALFHRLGPPLNSSPKLFHIVEETAQLTEKEPMAAKKAKKKVFSAVKAVKANARERVGQPKPERVIEEKPRKRKEKHKATLSEIVDKGNSE
jgi:hypothetical protein